MRLSKISKHRYSTVLWWIQSGILIFVSLMCILYIILCPQSLPDKVCMVLFSYNSYMVAMFWLLLLGQITCWDLSLSYLAITSNPWNFSHHGLCLYKWIAVALQYILMHVMLLWTCISFTIRIKYSLHQLTLIWKYC